MQYSQAQQQQEVNKLKTDFERKVQELSLAVKAMTQQVQNNKNPLLGASEVLMMSHANVANSIQIATSDLNQLQLEQLEEISEGEDLDDLGIDRSKFAADKE